MLFIYDGKRHRQSGTTMQKTLPAHEVARRATARHVRKGFPAKPFETEEDVAAYVSEDTICCLLCGRHLKQLGAHLAMIHNTDAKEYRTRFNIPWRYPLDGVATRERKRQLGLRPENRERIRKIGKTMRTTGYRPPCELGRKAMERACPTWGNDGEPKYKDFSWHISVADQWPHPKPPEGEASWATFKKRRASDPSLHAAYEQVRASRPVHERTLRRRNRRAEKALSLMRNKALDSGLEIC